VFGARMSVIIEFCRPIQWFLSLFWDQGVGGSNPLAPTLSDSTDLAAPRSVEWAASRKTSDSTDLAAPRSVEWAASRKTSDSIDLAAPRSVEWAANLPQSIEAHQSVQISMWPS
jgi:hypothetical protein